MSNITANNDFKRNRILFDFESIVDLKISYLKKVLNLNKLQVEELKFEHMYSQEDIMQYLNGKEVDEEKYLHPESPVFTSLKLLADTYQNGSNGLVKPTVLCKDGIQQRIIKDSIPNIKTLVGLRKQVKTIRFSRIAIGNILNVLDFRDPITVDFMILNYRENFDKNNSFLLNTSALGVCDVNRFSVAKAYTEIQDPEG